MPKLANTDHPIHDLLRTRWSPRAFADRPVEKDKLLRMLEAARWAPSSYNGQPWAFIVGTRDQPEQYARVLSCLVEFNQSWAKAAPVLILTAAQLNFEHNGQPNRHAGHDVGSAVAQLTLQATSEGLFVHQMAGIVPDKVRSTFNVPAVWDPMTAIAIGYLGEASALPESLREKEIAPTQRKPLSSFVFGGNWGETATIATQK